MKALPPAVNTSSADGSSTNPAPPLSPEDQAKVATAVLQYFQHLNPMIEELRTASRRPGCRFNICTNGNPGTASYSYLAIIRNYITITSFRATAELVSGRTEQAYEDIKFSLFLLQCLGNSWEPVIAFYVITSSVCEMLRPVCEGMRRRQWSDAQLASLQAAFQHTCYYAEYQKALTCERAIINAQFDYLCDHPTDLTNYVSLVWIGYKQPTRDQLYFLSFLPKGWLQREQINFNRRLTRLNSGFDAGARRVHVPLIKSNYYDWETLGKNGLVRMVMEHQIMQEIFMSGLNNGQRKAAQTQCWMDLATVACAIERYRLAHGHLPGSLDALMPRFMDPLPKDWITGEPYKYLRDDDRQYRIYSVGWNETDDHGDTFFPTGSSTPDFNHGDWVWAQP